MINDKFVFFLLTKKKTILFSFLDKITYLSNLKLLSVIIHSFNFTKHFHKFYIKKIRKQKLTQNYL